MTRFYENLLGRYDASRGTFAAGEPMPKAAALHEARRWLRELSTPEALGVCRNLNIADTRLQRGGPQLTLGKPVTLGADATEDRPFAHPYYWAAFILIGDPE
jgi:CHAT domain-containing protein